VFVHRLFLSFCFKVLSRNYELRYEAKAVVDLDVSTYCSLRAVLVAFFSGELIFDRLLDTYDLYRDDSREQ